MVMIATGGLLRINARRQDSLRSKTHKTPFHKRKNKKRRRNEVVVVKGKLKLISVSGLVAALGILVLLVGMVMAALGYWPQDGLFFRAQPHEGATMVSASSIHSTPALADAQGGWGEEELEESHTDEGKDKGGGDDGFNQTTTRNGTTQQLSQGFLEDFLDRYLYSDRLKVLGPLIMGIGIFLFICANAVLHENRDKKTKVINLQDIYSTVIDLHNLHKPNSTSARRSSTNPLNGLINYVQSKGLDTNARACPAPLLNKREGEEGGGLLSSQPWSDGSSLGGDAVFSINQEHSAAPPTPSSSHSISLPHTFNSPHFLPRNSLEKEVLSSFTLPLCRPRPPAPRRRHSAWAGMSFSWLCSTGGGKEHRREGGCQRQDQKEEMYTCPLPPLCSSTPPSLKPCPGSCSSSSLHREAPGGSQSLLIFSSSLNPSQLSLSSLSQLLSSSLASSPPACRKCSLPTAGLVTHYSELKYGEEISFVSTDSTLSHHSSGM